MIARAQPWLGTMVGIRVAPCRQAEAAVDAAFAAIRLVHELMSFHRPESELSALNQRAHQGPIAVAQWTYAVIAHALELSQVSDGLFDCTVAPYLTARGLLPVPMPVPMPEKSRVRPPSGACALRRASYRDVELLDGCRIRFRRALWIDLGGIAKGFAVDRAVEALRAHGVAAASVNAGGDLRVFGEHVSKILVRLPGDSYSTTPLMNLHNSALATSATYLDPSSGETGAAVSPLIDPRTGAGCGNGFSVSVHAHDCVTADALTKVVAVSQDPHHPALAELGASALLLRARRPCGRGHAQ